MEKLEISKKEYNDLIQKANGFRLQSECFDELRKLINPNEKQLSLPWYEMITECIVEKINQLPK